MDDYLERAQRKLEERLATVGVRNDAERADRLEKLEYERAHRAWMDEHAARMRARLYAETPPPDLEAAARTAEQRINNAWRPKP